MMTSICNYLTNKGSSIHDVTVRVNLDTDDTPYVKDSYLQNGSASERGVTESWQRRCFDHIIYGRPLNCNSVKHSLYHCQKVFDALVFDFKFSLRPCQPEFEELETTIKVENYNKRDADLVANIVKSELIEFHSNQKEEIFLQKDVKTVLLEKMPKFETEILGHDDEPPSSSYELDDPFNNGTFEDSDLNLDLDPDPVRDPFADVGYDPGFSRHPPSQKSNDSAATQVQLINKTEANDSSNPSASAQSVLAKTGSTSRTDRKRKKVNSKLHCQLCLDSRYSKTWLKTHLVTCAATHKDRHLFCIPCNALFWNHETYRQHSLRIHGIEVAKLKEWLFKCQFCPCSFALKDELVSHLASHPEVNTTDEEDLKRWPYRCQECPSTFKHYSLYTLHMTSHNNERPFKCLESNCGKAFKSQSSLKNHLLCHSDERPFKCPEPNCGKTYKTNSELKLHVVCHSEERPFQCFHSDCCKTFKRKDRLREHLARHTEALRLKNMARTCKCQEPGCFARYTKVSGLKIHIKQKHKR